MLKTIKRLVLVTVAAMLLGVGWMAYYAYTPLRVPSLPAEFTLKHGSSLKSVSRQLTEAGLLQHAWSFTLLVRALGKAGDIKAGNYQLEQSITPLQLFYKISRGDASQSEITFIEGWSFKQLRAALDQHPGVRHDTAGLSEQDVLSKIEVNAAAAEGLLFPDTYYFSSGMSDISLLKRASQVMNSHLAKAWEAREPGLPYADSYQALVMASIVEKETGQAAERPLISAVFCNRLRLGMKLQTDPTVIYGMGENFDGNLHKQDLTADTAYNTYTRLGLPPTPIAMPGLDAINAVLHPAKTSALYFVAKGDGTHQFSASLAQHNQAVARYQKSAAHRRALN
jgi:UPF0755 protein